MTEVSQELGQVVMESLLEERQLVGLVLVLEQVVELVVVKELESLVEEWVVLLWSGYYFKVDFLHC